MPDNEIQENMKLAGLTWPIHQRLVTAFYNVDQKKIGTVLEDQSEYKNNAKLSNIQLVEVSRRDLLTLFFNTCFFCLIKIYYLFT